MRYRYIPFGIEERHDMFETRYPCAALALPLNPYTVHPSIPTSADTTGLIDLNAFTANQFKTSLHWRYLLEEDHQGCPYVR